MVFKSVSQIQKALPEVLHIAMFYNNGTIYQTTIDQEYNIPKLGEYIAEALNQLRKVYETCNFRLVDYKKLIFETDEISTIILKLGEDSNLAMFFKKELDINQKLKSIHRYIKKIEELIDVDKVELEFQELERINQELKKLNEELNFKQEKIKELEEKQVLLDPEIDKVELKENIKKLQELNEEYRLLNQECEIKKNEMISIREAIEEERKKKIEIL